MTPAERAVVDAAVVAVAQSEALHTMQIEHGGKAEPGGLALTLDRAAREYAARADAMRADAALTRAVRRLLDEREASETKPPAVYLDQRTDSPIAKRLADQCEAWRRAGYTIDDVRKAVDAVVGANPETEPAPVQSRSPVLVYLERNPGASEETISGALGWTQREVMAELDRLYASGLLVCREGMGGKGWFPREQAPRREGGS